METIDHLVLLSRYYGGDPNWLIAGGGNSSMKDETTLWIKASGTSLAGAGPESFVAMDRSKLSAILKRSYPEDVAERERAALVGLMDSRRAGQSLRPSVETGMHDLFPQRFVLHTHPTLVNGLTCAKDGERVAQNLFGDHVLWIPSVNPGYILSKRLEAEIAGYIEQHGHPPAAVLLQNHGLTVAADSTGEVHRLNRDIAETVLSRVDRDPDMGAADVDLAQASRVGQELREAYRERLGAGTGPSHGHGGGQGESSAERQPTVLFEANQELLQRAVSRATMMPLLRPFSPDHIVYAGYAPVYVTQEKQAAEAFAAAAGEGGAPPKVVVVKDLGCFAIGPTYKAAESARLLFRDALKIATLTESFGGPRAMDDDQAEFIQGWEVERFRSQVSLGN